VQGIEHDAFAQSKIEATLKELLDERQEIAALL